MNELKITNKQTCIGILYRFPNKGETQSRRIPLYKCQFEEYRPNDQNLFAFKITSPSRFVLQ